MKNRSLIIPVVLVAVVSLACAQTGPPPEMFRNVPNVGRVMITFCADGWFSKVCVDREPEAWGQLCDPGGARFAAKSYLGQHPEFAKVFSYRHWRCLSQLDPKTAPWPMEGDAGAGK